MRRSVIVAAGLLQLSSGCSRDWEQFHEVTPGDAFAPDASDASDVSNDLEDVDVPDTVDASDDVNDDAIVDAANEVETDAPLDVVEDVAADVLDSSADATDALIDSSEDGPDDAAQDGSEDAAEDAPIDAVEDADAADVVTDVDEAEAGCEAGATYCQGNTPVLCDNGTWEAQSPCTTPFAFCVAGQCVACTVPGHCGTNDECVTYTCSNNSCGQINTPAGTALSQQTDADCEQVVCDGTGAQTSQLDPDDNDDGNECTVDSCNGSIPVHNISIGTICGLNGTCDTTGDCDEAVTGCGDIGGLQPGSPWPMLGYCPSRPSRSPFVGPSTLSVNLTSTPPLSNWLGRATIAQDGTVYAGGWTGIFLMAFQPDATMAWDFPATGVICTAIGRNGTIYAPSNTGILFAVRPDGTQLWSFNMGSDSSVGCPVVGGDRTIYVGGDETLFAIHPDGTEAWSFNTGALIRSAPSIGPDGTIFVGSDSDSLYALDPSDGSENWSFPTGGDISSIPTIAPDGTIYVGSADNHLYAINPNGTEAWKFLTGWHVANIALAADGTVFFSSWDQRVYAVDAAGNELWRYLTCGVPRGGFIIGADGTVYVGVMNNCDRLYALDPTNGSVIDSVDGVGYLGGIGNDGLIYAVSGSQPSNSETMIVIGPE